MNGLEKQRAGREDRAERLAFILDGRRRGMSYAAIGRDCDPPISQQRVYQIYAKALADIPAPNLAELRREERERLETLLERYEEIIDNGAAEPKLVMEALRGIQAVGESLRKLDGMDAPARHEVTTEATVHYRVVGVPPEELEAL
jgi:DNA-binding transcriptional MerR regulator